MIDRRFLHEHLHEDITSIIGKKLVIFGCGAIGANLSISLVRRGFKSFYLFDGDKIKEHNLSTQPWTFADIYKMKTASLSAILYSISRIEAQTYPKVLKGPSEAERIFEANKFLPDLIIDCFDSNYSRHIAQCIYPDYEVLHVGLSKENTGEIHWAKDYVIPKDIKLDDPCNYPLSRTIIDMTVTMVFESIKIFLQSNKQKGFFINANNFTIRETS
jgi:hypothetical protein